MTHLTQRARLEDERRIMQEHVAYWTERLREGIAVAFGPVADPNGASGPGEPHVVRMERR